MFQPYKDQSTNVLYNLLFCDDLELFRTQFRSEPTGLWKELFSSNLSETSLSFIASDDQVESRTRLLAFNALRTQRKTVAEKQVLGVVVERGMSSGLDTIAAYKDGRARYFNYSGKMIIWEVPADAAFQDRIGRLLSASQNVVDKIGPWDKPRLAPPGKGLTRMTFLVTDGLYFGQAPDNLLEHDPMGGPVVAQAFGLMLDLINRANTAQKK